MTDPRILKRSRKKAVFSELAGRPLRVVHVIPNLHVGGMERVVIDLVTRLDAKRFEPLVCCLEDGGALAGELAGRCRVIELGRRQGGFNWALPGMLARVFRREAVDLIHTHNLRSRNYAVLAALLSGRPPLINTKHGRAYTRSNRIFWNRLANVVVRRHVAVSDAVGAALRTSGGVRARDISVIINGIDVDRYACPRDRGAEDVRRLVGADRVIGTVGRLVRVKNHRGLIEAFSRILRTTKAVKLVVVGDGPLENALREQCRQLGIEGSVVFLGARNDVPRVMCFFDVFVLSSLDEGTSLTLLEAMAAGLPVIATNVGGNPEIVEDGRTGLIVPAADPGALADSITRCFADTEAAKQMGERGRERICREYGVDRMVREYEQLYLELMIAR